MSQRLWHHGSQYAGASIDPATAPEDPYALFAAWFGEAEAAPTPNVNAMTLATADERGRPSARIVLLKEVDARGFVFFTNYESRKARELEASGVAALLFYWQAFERQVRIEGRVERIEAAVSDAYFATRPRGSRIGAIASPQSQAIASRGELEARFAEIDAGLGVGEPVRPAWWGGYRVAPERFEFWQGQPSRLHDRVVYTPGPDGTGWVRGRLAP